MDRLRSSLRSLAKAAARSRPGKSAGNVRPSLFHSNGSNALPTTAAPAFDSSSSRTRGIEAGQRFVSVFLRCFCTKSALHCPHRDSDAALARQTVARASSEPPPKRFRRIHRQQAPCSKLPRRHDNTTPNTTAIPLHTLNCSILGQLAGIERAGAAFYATASPTRRVSYSCMLLLILRHDHASRLFTASSWTHLGS
jgi:hypothetical protein